jgi:superfamily II DNA/RNA helicase
MTDLRMEVMYGGQPVNDHVTILKGLKPPHIIVGTPGRIL